MKVLRLFLAIIIVALSSYGLITDTPGVTIPYALLFIGIMLLVSGVIEFKKRNATSFTLFLVAGFCSFVVIYTLFS